MDPPDQGCTARLTRSIQERFELEEGLTGSHVYVFFIAQMMTISSFVFMNVCQAHILTHLGVELQMNGLISGQLVFWDEVMSVLCIGIWGFVSDILGRQLLYAVGFWVMGLGLALYPHASVPLPKGPEDFFVSLLCYRLIFSVGCSIVASLMAALLSDTVRPSSRPKFAGIVGFFSGIGAVMGATLFPSIPLWLGLHVLPNTKYHEFSYYLIASCLALTGFAVLVWIAPGPKRVSRLALPADLEPGHSPKVATSTASSEGQDDLSGELNPSLTIKQRLRLGLLAARHPLIALSYLSGFVARSITMINTTFVSLWVVTLLQRDGLCPGERTLPCLLALSTERRLNTIVQTASLVLAPFYGTLASRISVPLSICLASLFNIFGYGLLVWIEQPRSAWQYLASFLIGTGQIGVIVSGLALVSIYSPSRLRGSISGMYSFCGALGILVNSLLASTLFDIWTPVAPFILLVFFSVLLFFTTLLVAFLSKSNPILLEQHHLLDDEIAKTDTPGLTPDPSPPSSPVIRP